MAAPRWHPKWYNKAAFVWVDMERGVYDWGERTPPRNRDGSPRVVIRQVLIECGRSPGYGKHDWHRSDEFQELLEKDWGVAANVWSCPSFNELARDGQDAARWNRLNPLEAPRVPYVTQALSGAKGPFIAATDYMKNYAEQIRAFVPGRYTVLGTDGFGRSDSRVNLRRFFEVDANHIAAAAMVDLFREGAIDEATLRDALSRYDIDGGKPNPRLV